MKKTLLFAALAASLSMSAQEFDWQWAKKGGGTKAAASDGESGLGLESEQIIDIVVDADNNYYYLAFITQQNTEIDGTPVPVYNSDNQEVGFTDIALFSTDCEGSLRWAQTIGGGDRDFAYKIVVDNDGGLYLGANVMNISGPLPNVYLPPHFSPDDAMPVLGDNTGAPQEGYKTAAVLKYNTNDGSLAWRVMPQSDVTMDLRWARLNQVLIDSEGTLHVLVGFMAGSHLDGQVIVPDTFTSNLHVKYSILKFDADGAVTDVVPLPLEGYLPELHTDFKYDENLGRYYLGGFRNFGGSSELFDLSYGGVAFTEQDYLLAFETDGTEIWRKEMTAESPFRDNRIYDLAIDEDSSLYIAGKYLCDLNAPQVALDDYLFPTTISGNVVFIMKMDPEGEVQWLRTPSGYNLPQVGNIFSGSHFAYDLLINGDQIAVATQIANEIWGDFTFSRPTNHRSDPAIMMLDKATGEPLAVHDVMGISGYDDAFTALALDADGNYVAGGYFLYNLWSAEDDNLPTLDKVSNQANFSDFFIAKFAATPCGTPVAGLDGPDQATISIFPNPSTGIINIDTSEVLASYEISTVLGQVVLKGNFEPQQSAISLESLSSGTYFIKVKTADSRVITHKIIRE